MTKILAFSGRKQSGKTTCSNFIHGYQLRAFRAIENFAITEEGSLLIATDSSSQEYGELDVRRKDQQFAEWASYNMWPYVKSYSLAMPLKLMAIELFGVKEEQVFGTDAEKNTKTHLMWEDMPGINENKGPMTAREFLQFFGTEVCRNIHQDIWADRLIKDIQMESSLLAIVDDVRFENEVEAIQGAGGKVIRLTRSLYEDNHSSETNLDECEKFDAIIDNQDMNINETNHRIIGLLDEWGWLGEEVSTQEQKPELVGGIHKIKENN